MRVLLVDDDPTQRLLLRRFLEKTFGAHVVEANDGVPGLAKFAEAPADLVLLDVEMPVMDGPTMLEELRRKPGGADVPVVAISSISEKRVVQQMIGFGVRDYIIKPLDWQRVEIKLERLFRRIGHTGGGSCCDSSFVPIRATDAYAVKCGYFRASVSCLTLSAYRNGARASQSPRWRLSISDCMSSLAKIAISTRRFA